MLRFLLIALVSICWGIHLPGQIWVYKFPMTRENLDKGMPAQSIDFKDLRGKWIKIKWSKDHKEILPADSVWGYKNAEGALVRIFKGTHYHVDEWDTPVVYIDYRKESVILQSPRTAIGKARLISSLNPSVYKNYYFSKDINSPINPMTKKCLKREFSDNPAFLENLDKETNL